MRVFPFVVFSPEKLIVVPPPFSSQKVPCGLTLRLYVNFPIMTHAIFAVDVDKRGSLTVTMLRGYAIKHVKEQAQCNIMSMVRYKGKRKVCLPCSYF